MRSNSASRNLINVFGKISDLNLETDKLLSIYKIPNHYQNYKRLSLYFGDWRRVEADILYLRNRREFERLLVLSKIANFKVPYNIGLQNNNNTINRELDPDKEEQLLECSDFVKNCKFIYFGTLTKFVPTKHLKSLIIPLDLYSEFYDLEPNNYSYFERMSDYSDNSKSNASSTHSGNSSNSTGSKDSKQHNSSDSAPSSYSKFNTYSQSAMYQRGLNSLNNARALINFLEGMESMDKVLLCAENNSTWNTYHKLLKYS